MFGFWLSKREGVQADSGRDDAVKHSAGTGQPPTTKNYLVPNIDGRWLFEGYGGS